MNMAIVIVNWNGRELLRRCLRSIAATTSPAPPQIWIVDNGSTDGSQAMVRADFPQVCLIDSPRNLGFAGGNNLGLRMLLQGAGVGSPPAGSMARSAAAASLGPHPAPPEYILLLNPDTIVQPGALQALVRFMDAYPHVGVAGALLRNEDGTFQASYVSYPTIHQEFLILSGLGRARHGPWFPSAAPDQSTRHRDDVDYVIGACMIARTSAVCEVGLLDEGYFMYSEEVDWCYRFKAAGWAVGYVPDAEITHVGGGSTRHVRPQMLAELYRSRVRFFRKHYGAGAALLLRALLLMMNGTKVVRAALRPRVTAGTPPLSWSLLRHALALGETGKPS